MNLDALRKFLLIAFGLGFLGVYVAFLVQVVQASDGQPPNFNEAVVNFAATISGAIGSAFAVALGVNADNASPSRLLFRGVSEADLLKIGLWLYAIVGVAAALVYGLNPNETPGSISTLAFVFVGYVAALVTNAYKGVLPQ